MNGPALVAIAAIVIVATMPWRRSPRRPRPTVELKTSAVLLICGDCAGEEALPVKTRMTSRHTCASCGGRAYVLASTFGRRLALPDLRPAQSPVVPLAGYKRERRA